MHRTVYFRLLAFCVALLGSLSAPASALAHALIHVHLADGHGGGHSSGHHDQHWDEQRDAHLDEHQDEHYPHARPRTPVLAFESHPNDDHAHGHPSFDAVPGSRLNCRLDSTTSDPATLSTPDATVRAVVVVHAAALADHALLARPDPGDGSPPRLRAPPSC